MISIIHHWTEINQNNCLLRSDQILTYLITVLSCIVTNINIDKTGHKKNKRTDSSEDSVNAETITMYDQRSSNRRGQTKKLSVTLVYKFIPDLQIGTARQI